MLVGSGYGVRGVYVNVSFGRCWLSGWVRG